MKWSDFSLKGICELSCDEFCGSLFGKELQIKVLGSNVNHNYSKSKRYFVECLECKKDPELFGEGIFISSKSNLLKGCIPCGCSRRPSWTEEQMKIRLDRVSVGKNYKVVGWAEEYKGDETRVHIKSEVGESKSSIIRTLMLGSGCPLISDKLIGIRSKKSDESMIAGFIITGQFHQDTVFKRNTTRVNNKGSFTFWDVICPDCNTEYTSHCTNLKAGKLGCDCGKYRQRQAYINIIDDGTMNYLKFGVANISRKRLWGQNSNNTLKMTQLCVYEFSTKSECLSAERECRGALVCGVVDKQLIPDGWTETTYSYNLDKIVEIYIRHGGHKISNPPKN